MDIPSFEEIRDQLYQYFQDQDYEAALTLVDNAMGSYTDHKRELYFWRMEILSRLQSALEAIETFQEAQAEGFWYHPLEMESDELIALHGLPLFDALLAQNRERYEAAQAEVQPALRLYTPEAEPPYPVIMVLHGNGSNAHYTHMHWQSVVKQGYLLAIPESGQLMAPDTFFWNDTRQAIQDLRGHWQILREQFELDLSHSIIAGHSGGAGLAIWLLFNNVLNLPLAGFIASSPYIPDIENQAEMVARRKDSGLRGYIMVGTQDMMCLPTSNGLRLFMQQEGLACHLDMIPGLRHDYPADFAQRLTEALAFVATDNHDS